ncbi:ethionine resistance protein [Spiromyces aspiralis]|uniref:Ethionine resistance protein n=1 Tax=Spiromyces aspiralis TaxID=68401 RepID=A0ACC1HWS9_9FUNG|nr:ethionine resistance protein [Spiromyces aspiralis]
MAANIGGAQDAQQQQQPDYSTVATHPGSSSSTPLPSSSSSSSPSEATPLLLPPDPTAKVTHTDSAATLCWTTSPVDESNLDDPRALRRAVKEEAVWLTVSGLSMILTYLCQYSFTFVNTLVLGHLGPKELGAASLAIATSGSIILAPATGYAVALDTFCSTAFTAFTDKRAVGFHLQRGLLAATLHYCLTFPFLWNIEWILVVARQDPEIARLCGQFMRIYLFSALPWMLFECLKRFLQAQGDMKTSTKLLVFIAPLHAVITYLLVWSPWLGLGYVGSPLACCVTNWLTLVGLVVYISCSKAREAWGGFDYRCVYGISEFYKVALPSAMMVCNDWWAFEGLTICASYLGSTALAAQAIVFNTSTMIVQMPFGMSTAVGTRVGHMLGAGRSRTAKLTVKVGYAVTAAFLLVTVSTIIRLSSWWGSIYTSDPEVIHIVAVTLRIVAFTHTVDTFNLVNLGIFRAMGRQRISVLISLLPYYVTMFPVGLYLAFSSLDMGVPGLWTGMLVGLILIVVGQFTFMFGYIDWDREVVACLERLKKSTRIDGQSLKLNVEQLENGEGGLPVIRSEC